MGRVPSSEQLTNGDAFRIVATRGRYGRILLVDDDALVLSIARAALEEGGYDVMAAGSAEEGLEVVHSCGVPDLAILDIRLPRRSGLELGRILRKTSDLPIVMLTSVDDEATVVDAIQEFADDYVRKPFNPNELTARVSRILGRCRALAHEDSGVFRLDDVTLDLTRRRVCRDGEWTSLTPTEGKILEALVVNTGHVVTRRRLLDHVWPDGEVFEDALRVNVHRLRRKIELDPANPKYLCTERGIGYLFNGTGDIEV